MFSPVDRPDLELSGTVRAFEWRDEPPRNVTVINGVCGGRSGNWPVGVPELKKMVMAAEQNSSVRLVVYLQKAMILMTTSSAMTNALSFKKSLPRSATSRTLIMPSLATTMPTTMMRALLVQRHNHHHQSPRHAPPRARSSKKTRRATKATKPLLQSDLLLAGLQHLLRHRRNTQGAQRRRNQRNGSARARGHQRSHQQQKVKSRPKWRAGLRIGLSPVMSRSHPNLLRTGCSTPPDYY